MTGRDSTAGPRLLPLPVAPRSSAEEILEVLHAAYRREARLLRVDSFPPLERTVEGVEGAATRFFGLRRQGRLAAVAEIAGLGEDRRGIWSFVVHPDFFRQGLGSRLLKLLLERFRGSALEVSTARANEPALRLYEKLGFRRTKLWQHPRGLEMVTLELSESRRGKSGREELEA